uniref:Uncharacterized protein n=1 Tax=Setaria viridis TaxID=4556 RepID=A0A4U6UA45_SETVI|nr:hypothetical protein SEVIR_5G055100v2 [Setaria viridis]
MEDRLSSLPDDLLHSILRGVPLKHAARTSALSRRWVAHWIRALAASPVLDFTDSNFACGQPPARAAATVDRCLRLHAEHGTPLHVFRVALVSPSVPGDGAFGRDVVGWIAAAVTRGAREVEVDLTPSQEDANPGSAAFLELPRDLFRARNSLERLALGRLSLRAVPLPAAGLAGLRSLSLSHADVTDEALRGVLANCGALESLSLRCCSLLTTVSVASERLRVLELLGCRSVRELRVAAPALESFALYGNVILSVTDWFDSVAVDFGAAPALRDVYLSQMDCCGSLDRNIDYYYPFVYHVPQARILTLCSVGLVVPIFSLDSDDDNHFDHFPYAHLNGDDSAYIDMPNLQELQLLMGSLEEEMSTQDPRFPERVYYFFNYTSLPVLERLFIPRQQSCKWKQLGARRGRRRCRDQIRPPRDRPRPADFHQGCEFQGDMARAAARRVLAEEGSYPRAAGVGHGGRRGSPGRRATGEHQGMGVGAAEGVVRGAHHRVPPKRRR